MGALGEGIVVVSGTLPQDQIDLISKTHYYPDASINISLQAFVPASLQPSSVVVRCRRGEATGTAIQCRIFDVNGSAVPVANPSISIDGTTSWQNNSFSILGDSASFPSLGLWVVELDFSNIDIAGILLCYRPAFPFLVGSCSTPLNCSTTVVIS